MRNELKGYEQPSSFPSSSSKLLLSTSSSAVMLVHSKAHMSVHLSPAFKQQQESMVHDFFQTQANISRTSSGAGLEPSHLMKMLHSPVTSHPWPWGRRSVRKGDYNPSPYSRLVVCS